MAAAPIRGRCLCGAVEVSVFTPLVPPSSSYSAIPTLTCHCTPCKARSGGLASYAFCVPSHYVSISAHTLPSPSSSTDTSALTSVPILSSTATPLSLSTTSQLTDSAVPPNPTSIAGLSPITTSPHVASAPTPTPAEGPHAYKVYTERRTTSGKPMQRTFCSECGSPVAVIEGEDVEKGVGEGKAQGTICLQYGLFAEAFEDETVGEGEGVIEGRSRLPKPQLEMFAGRRCLWEDTIGKDVKMTQ